MNTRQGLRHGVHFCRKAAGVASHRPHLASAPPMTGLHSKLTNFGQSDARQKHVARAYVGGAGADMREGV